ncbi:MAG: DUF2970 domain-containing protein [Hydrogenophaga sp.]
MSTTPVHQRRAGLWETTRAVLWGFLGVRRGRDFHEDVARLNPLHLMAMGVVMALLFVFGLILLVNWVVG